MLSSPVVPGGVSPSIYPLPALLRLGSPMPVLLFPPPLKSPRPSSPLCESPRLKESATGVLPPSVHPSMQRPLPTPATTTTTTPSTPSSASWRILIPRIYRRSLLEAISLRCLSAQGSARRATPRQGRKASSPGFSRRARVTGGITIARGAGATGRRRGVWDRRRGAATSSRRSRGSSRGRATSRDGYDRLAVSAPTEADGGTSDSNEEDDDDDDGDDGDDNVDHLCALYRVICSFCPRARSVLLPPVPSGDGDDGDGDDARIASGVLPWASALLGHASADPEGAAFAQIIRRIRRRGAPLAIAYDDNDGGLGSTTTSVVGATIASLLLLLQRVRQQSSSCSLAVAFLIAQF
jgi:hypothetical protein